MEDFWRTNSNFCLDFWWGWRVGVRVFANWLIRTEKASTKGPLEKKNIAPAMQGLHHPEKGTSATYLYFKFSILIYSNYTQYSLILISNLICSNILHYNKSSIFPQHFLPRKNYIQFPWRCKKHNSNSKIKFMISVLIYLIYNLYAFNTIKLCKTCFCVFVKFD